MKAAGLLGHNANFLSLHLINQWEVQFLCRYLSWLFILDKVAGSVRNAQVV